LINFRDFAVKKTRLVWFFLLGAPGIGVRSSVLVAIRRETLMPWFIWA